MRILVFNSAVDPVAVGTDDDWFVAPDAELFRDGLYISGNAPDLYDYHVFIANANALQRSPRPEKKKNVTEQLHEMIAAGCVLICFIDAPADLGWLPRKLETRGGAGAEISIIEDTPLSEILSKHVRQMTYGTQLDGWGQYAAATNKHSVAVGTDHGSGGVLVLPTFQRPHLVVRDILRTFIPQYAPSLVARLAHAPIKEDIPDWVSDFPIPSASVLEKEIEELDVEQGKLEQTITDKKREWEKVDRFRGLLWAYGENWLEPLVRDALALLGVPGEPERPIDFVHRFGEDQELWAEIGGTEGCTQVAKGSQLLRYMADEPDRAPNVTGAIISNPYRLENPNNRPPAGSQEGLYSNPLVNLAGKQNWSLVTTTAIFDLVCQHLDGDEQAAQKIRELLQLPPL